jgi:hypothetical protein
MNWRACVSVRRSWEDIGQGLAAKFRHGRGKPPPDARVPVQPPHETPSLPFPGKEVPSVTVIPRLSFKEMCAKFEVTPRTLRYYEYIELLAPKRRAAPASMARARWRG